MTNNNKHGFQNQGVISDPPSPFDCSSLREVQEAMTSQLDKEIARPEKSPHSLEMLIPICLNRYFFCSIMCILDFVYMMTVLNGGTTLSLGLGSYFDRQQRLLWDLIVIINIQSNEEKFSHSLVQLRESAHYIRKKLNQEAIAIQIDGSLELI